jgi:transposase InsO family protein
MILLIFNGLYLLYANLKFTAFLSSFHAFVHTQFALPLQEIQGDNGKEFNDRSLQNLASTHGIHVCFSCPYTSHQNDKAERAIRTFNNIARTLLFQASMPPKFWVESPHTTS